MAFDRTDPADLATLKAYIADPTQGTAEILALCNDPANNPSPANGANPMTAESLIDAAWESNVSSQDQFKVQLLIEGTNSFEDDLSDFRLRAIDLSAGIGATINANVRALSWAEVTFGAADANGVWESVVITAQDWFEARDS